MLLLNDKVAVVTGAGTQSSIGAATARVFAAHGARVAMLDIDEQAVTQSCKQLGEQHRAYVIDVADQDQCQRTVADVAAEFGRIDILVNSAGIVHGSRILDITQQEYDQIMDNNLRGNFLMSQAVVPHMKAQGAGNIICVSSIAGQSGGGVFGSSHYAAAKSGIFGLAKALARELATDGIRANAVAPGPVDNDFTKGRMTRQIKDEIASKVPLGRLGTPEDVANACLFLASDLSSYITGIVLDVNGGLLIH
jgi:NAD(P)-dependent dehydrogenase (short-subunit alcohol dehydrogenase family)